MMMATITPLIAVTPPPLAPTCAALTSDASDYWVSVSACGPCLAAGCAFSLNSLQCSTTVAAAADALALVGDPAVCPSPPSCAAATCDGCLALGPDCAWCGREATCLPSNQAHSGAVPCTAVQFSAPCRAPEERAWGVCRGCWRCRVRPFHTSLPLPHPHLGHPFRDYKPRARQPCDPRRPRLWWRQLFRQRPLL